MMIMDEMPQVDVQALLPVVRERMEVAVQKMMQAVNHAPAGELITASEEAAREIGHELTRAVYEAALQLRITAAEAAFPPSARRSDGPQAAE
jgi:O6-methylguanine-DNA--protein-cysteine methyltransferase